MKIATCFGSSTVRKDNFYYQEGESLGQLLAQNDYIIKNGGFDGLMEAVAKGARMVSNSQIIGVTNKEFRNLKPFPVNEYITHVREQNNIYSRLEELIFESDIFIVQYGGIGTLSELTLVWTMLYMNSLPKNPKLILLGAFWKDVLDSFRMLPIKEIDYSHLLICNSLNELKKNL